VSDVQCGANLVEVRAGEKQAVFEHANGQHSTVPFDFLHVVPPTTPHPFIAQSQLANAEGWVSHRNSPQTERCAEFEFDCKLK
jgi:hypothetical protein